jgi:hypothetical protein
MPQDDGDAGTENGADARVAVAEEKFPRLEKDFHDIVRRLFHVQASDLSGS